MKTTCHKRVVVRSVAECDEFHATVRIIVGGGMRNVFDDVAQQLHGVHVDAGFRGAHVHTRAHDVGFGESLRKRSDEQLFGRSHGLVHERRIAAQQVNAHFLARAVKRMGDFHEVFRRFAGRGAHKRDGGHGDALVNDGDAEFTLDGFARGDQIASARRNFGIDAVAEFIHVVARAIEQTDAHGDGTHVELFLLDHFIGLVDLLDINHRYTSPK